MKKYISIFLMLISVLLLTSCESNEKNLGIDFSVEGNNTTLNYDTKNPLVAMQIKGYGAIVIELYPEYAPNTVNNFISLTKSGYYDNNTFHRLVKGFVLQGGDKSGNGTGGPGYYIQGEFSKNNFKNDLKHTKGVVSMARSGLPNTAGSQFFIMLDDNDTLDGNYAAFGKVIDGFDIIEKIEKEKTVENKETGKLSVNLKITKSLVDLKDYEPKEVEKI